MLEIEWILTFLLLGSFVGFIAGLFGIGGGGLMVPILATIFLSNGIPMEKVLHLALGTSMASIIFTSIASFRAHHAKDAVKWNIVRGMSMGILLGTFLCTYVATLANTLFLAIFFSIFMGLAAVQMFRKNTKTSKNTISKARDLFIAGNVIGSISALVSIGGGSITVPFLVWKNIDLKKAIGTSAAIGLPLSIAGTLGYIINGWTNTSLETYTIGYVYLPAVVLISIMSYLVAPYGVKMAHHLPIGVLKKLFGVLLLILSIKMLFSVI